MCTEFHHQTEYQLDEIDGDSFDAIAIPGGMSRAGFTRMHLMSGWSALFENLTTKTKLSLLSVLALYQ